MTTPAELGLETPTGSDLISQGDNAISKNAIATAAIYDELNQFGGAILSTGNFNTALGKGANTDTYYWVNSGAANGPDVPWSGWLRVLTSSNNKVIMQTFLKSDGSEVLQRTYVDGSGGIHWGDWRRIDADQAALNVKFGLLGKRLEPLESLVGERVVNHVIDPAPADVPSTWTAGNVTLQQAPGWGRAIAAGGAGTSVMPKVAVDPVVGSYVPVTVGDPVAARMIIRAMDSQKMSATLNVRGWSWNGSTMTNMGTVATSTQLHIEPDLDVTFTAIGEVPAGVTHVDTWFTFRRFGETYPLASDFVYFRQAALFAGKIPTPLSYSDGNSPYSYWEGEENKSASVTMTPKESGAGAAAAHAVLLGDFTNRRGGRKVIGKKTSISFRVDHGLSNFNTKMRPKLETHGFNYALALGSRDWAASENADVTPAIVNGWVTGGLAEIWSHGVSHADADTPAKLRDYIVNSRIELERDIPAATVDGFMPPGAGDTRYMGFGPTDTPQKYFDTLAGQLILETYAIGTGQLPGTAYRVQDGVPRVGQAYFNMDTFTASGVMSRVGNAITEGKGIQLMIHPSLIDTAGHITTAELHSVLDQIKALQDAGTVLVMSAYDQLLADSTSPYIIDETAGRTVKVWDYLNNREQLIYGDTGTRTMPTATGTARISREGNQVSLEISSFRPQATGVIQILTLPSGFRPASSVPGLGIENGSIVHGYALNFSPYSVEIRGITTVNSFVSLSIKFRTNDPWPTSLPGVAA